jgi:rhodanese-related sulfurtransferase/rubrerythrin
LDVRQPSEYQEEHIPGAKLIPLPDLNDRQKEIDREKPMIVYCAVGGRSRVAAQLLSGIGFEEVFNLQGGIKAWQGQKATGPVELNLDLIEGDEPPGEILVFAYGLEKGLQTFYLKMIERADDSELKDLFQKLADIEEHHKRKVFELKQKVDPTDIDQEAFEAKIKPEVMEGGFDIETFMEQNASYLSTVQNVLTLAMMLETQALDLYLRFSDKSTNSQTKEILLEVSQEEKTHLTALGRLMEEKSNH